MRSLAETIISMPSVARSTSTGYSNSRSFARPKLSNVISSVSARADENDDLKKRVKPSETNAPPKMVDEPLPAKTATAAAISTAIASQVTLRPAASPLA